MLGTSEECARLLEELQASGRDPVDAVQELLDAGGKVPGFGHPVHRPVDPRAERILELADDRGVSGPHVGLARSLAVALAEIRGKPLTMNVALPIAAVMLDLGYPSAAVKAVPILARTAASSRTSPRRASSRSASSWPVPPRRRSSTSAEVETRPWDEQLALDDESYGAQIAYLLEHSPFYREKLGSSVSDRLVDIAHLPLTAKEELRESVTPESPFGAHFCADPSELVRIYSTSGTTGAPSYIPLTAGDLDNWVTASARSYAASGSQPASASSRPTTQGPSSPVPLSAPSSDSG